MNTFVLTLLDSHGSARFDDVRQLVASDASGSFGLLAGHEPMVAVLSDGLARFQMSDGRWRYLALPGGVLRCTAHGVELACVQSFIGDDPAALLDQLSTALARSDSDIARTRALLSEIETSLLRRLNEMGN